MRTPQQHRSADSADRMIEATLDLVAEGGLAAVTVAAVARRAATSNGALYHRFGGRPGLLLAAQDRALTAIEAETAAAFARADEEPDDEAAVLLLAESALRIFGEHRAAMRAFLVDARGEPAHDARTQRTSHALAALVTGWISGRLGATAADAEAAWRILFALGASQALYDDAQVSSRPLPTADLAAALARSMLAVARRAQHA